MGRGKACPPLPRCPFRVRRTPHKLLPPPPHHRFTAPRTTRQPTPSPTSSHRHHPLPQPAANPTRAGCWTCWTRTSPWCGSTAGSTSRPTCCQSAASTSSSWAALWRAGMTPACSRSRVGWVAGGGVRAWVGGCAEVQHMPLLSAPLHPTGLWTHKAWSHMPLASLTHARACVRVRACAAAPQACGGAACRRSPSTTSAARSASRATRTSSPCTSWSTTSGPSWTRPRRVHWPS